MVTQYGMTDFGFAQLDAETLRVGGEVAVLAHREIDRLIRDAHARAGALLAEHGELLRALVAALLDEETLGTGRLRELRDLHAPRRAATGGPADAAARMPAPRAALDPGVAAV
jgi:cell division protease FtsH